jgi:hypothetical protein
MSETLRLASRRWCMPEDEPLPLRAAGVVLHKWLRRRSDNRCSSEQQDSSAPLPLLRHRHHLASTMLGVDTVLRTHEGDRTIGSLPARARVFDSHNRVIEIEVGPPVQQSGTSATHP